MVSFNGTSKLIIVDNGTTSLNVQILYSDWKEWCLLSDNLKYLPAFSVIGGEPIGGGVFIDASYFLLNGWRIRPYEGNHKLDVVGNLYTEEEGGDPFVNTIGSYRVTINVRTSSRSQKVVSGSGVTTQDKTDIIDGVVDLVSADLTTLKNDTAIIKPKITNILGLVQQNFRYTDQSYDSNGNLTSGNIKIYNTASDMNSNASPISNYSVSATYDNNNRLVDYKVELI